MAYTGTAAHIYAAASGGPRGTGGLTQEQLSAIGNGIWLCAKCGRLVDTNEGNAYPASLLRSWRDLHEYRTRLEQGGYGRPAGWVQAIEIHEHFVIRPGAMRLSRGNLLGGMNATGKTQLLQLLRSMTAPQPLMDGSKKLSCTISWFDPDRRTAKVGVVGRSLEYEIDGKRVPLPPHPYRVLDVHPSWPRPHQPGMGWLADFLGVDEWTAGNVVSGMPEVMPDVFSHVLVTGDDIEVTYVEREEQEPASWRWMLFPFRALAVLAELQARAEPTILVLDDPFDHLHPLAVREVMNVFDSPALSFQTIIATHSPQAFAWAKRGWTATLLMPDGPHRSRISQDAADIDALLEGRLSAEDLMAEWEGRTTG
ncbi:AAA family ATPase [Streptomyces sp. NPDC058579]|uniref:AAA family ATPase n=1 Tax=Streptomyces sp. NPDC058579 TaxID=3346548 RepID=UPI003648EFB1